jgi:NIPSNAP
MLAWESLAEREQKWNAFMSDSEWLAKRAESERDGPIIQTLSNQILAPTAFSAVK